MLLQIYSFSTLIGRYPSSILAITDYPLSAVYGSQSACLGAPVAAAVFG